MIHRIDVQTLPLADGSDPLGTSVQKQIAEFGLSVGKIHVSRIFLVDTDAAASDVKRIATELLADPIVESASCDAALSDAGKSRIEIHLKPGVMDPVAASTEMAIADLGIPVRQVRTGRSYVIEGQIDSAALSRIANRILANGVIETVHLSAFIPTTFEMGRQDRFSLRHVTLRELSDAQLTKLSREGHLFLSLAEMRMIQNYFRQQNREPTDIELETFAQTWSEHCVHKTLKSAVDVAVLDPAGKNIGSRQYASLIKETIFDSTMQLMGKSTGAGTSKDSDNGPTGWIPNTAPHRDFCLSVFADNAGVVAFDETDAVCFKVETHNHPSAIEPYGGSATGAGGVIRDVLGTGLAARPIANTDIFCVAYPNVDASTLPKGVIHPRRVLQQIVAGVRDYGNRMGIPTVNGAVYFDDRYLGNPLVFCGCVGLIPRDKIQKAAQFGDAIVVVGGRTGRDGIHGATFSSAELTDTHADEFSHAVQIGNAITEKKVADVILAARDKNLFTGITDCGAGGLSSAVGEMGEKTGAEIFLDKAPLKYPGLRYDEIWISEAQERLVVSVPQQHVTELLNLAKAENVEATVIGTFGTEKRELILHYHGTEVGRISMALLHDGIPMPTRKATVIEFPKPQIVPAQPMTPETFDQQLHDRLSHPNIASKHWIIRQYDHEVQGGSVIKPLVGARQTGPSDAAVVRPKLGSDRGIALGCGMCPEVSDPYAMALASIDEAIRNVVAVGADPTKIAILDNFCWPSVDDETTMGTLVRACEACRDAALAYQIPFISGKDSLHNQFTNQETGKILRIPNTLLISAIAVLEDVRTCITMDSKIAGNHLALIAPIAGPAATPAELRALHLQLHQAIAAGAVVSCHDVSDGGIAIAVAEMCIASGLGATVNPSIMHSTEAFAEWPGRYIVEIPSDSTATFPAKIPSAKIADLGIITADPHLRIGNQSFHVDALTATWRGPLDW